jgi:hypothetical protein
MHDTQDRLTHLHVTADFDCGTLTVDWSHLDQYGTPFLTESEIFDETIEIVRDDLNLAELIDWRVDETLTENVTVYHVNVRIGCAVFRAGFGCFDSAPLSEAELLEEAVDLLRDELDSRNFEYWTVV